MLTEHLGKWALQNSQKLGLKVIEIPTLKKVTNGAIFQYIVEISHLSIIGRGCAIDTDEEMCVVRAIGEALERMFHAQYFPENNTNGLSYHTDLDQAIFNARNEVLERDNVLTAFYSGQTIEYKEYSSHLINPFVNDGIKFEIAEIKNNSTITYITRLDGRKFETPFNYHFGFSNYSIEKSLFEAMLNLNLHYNKNISYPRSLGSKPEDHYMFWSNPLNKNVQSNNLGKIKDVNIEFEDQVFSNLLFGELNVPGFFVRTGCSQLQNLNFGFTTLEHINNNRLEISQLGTEPHYIA